ncbi:MAG: leucyl aminopeptidase [Thermoplasmata archaeon]|nr:leucyl aminopeptidase [Thermoplasmata archaeon]MCI4359860.1 leucyl aminopeptidase [Thermoplasmata archaeon]
MKISIDRRDATEANVDVSVSGLPERAEKEEGLPRTLAREEAVTAGLVGIAWKNREIRGRRKEVTVFHRPDGKGRVGLVGLGPRDSVDVESIRRAAAEAVRALRGHSVQSIGLRLASFAIGSVAPEDAAAALAEGAVLGGYEFTRYRAPRDAPIEEATVFLGSEHGRLESAIRKAVERTRSVAEVVLWTRDLSNLPADTATPERLAEEARALGKEFDLKVTVFNEAKLAEMHCGGLLAVGGGSSHPPRLIVLEYAGGNRSGKTVAVVGKGITFDSGGISIKPALHMADMKFDKSGAVAVLGILRAAATLKLPPKVIGVLACAENLPGGGAYRPGDVVTTYNGKTIEILNTDAEGRVVLSDALAFAVDRYHPDVVIDLATLTGACVTALGDDTAGLISTNDALALALLDASARTGEPIWRLPLTDVHRELVKSEVADVRNSTEIPPAGALTAAAFLETFVGTTTAWAHLDIAGPAWTNSSTRKYQPAYLPVGATAFGVRLVTRYLEDGAR